MSKKVIPLCRQRRENNMMHIIRPHFLPLNLTQGSNRKAGVAKITMVTDRREVLQGTWSQSRCAYLEPSKGLCTLVQKFHFQESLVRKITHTDLFYLSVCCCLVSQSCPILRHTTDCSLPGSSTYGTFR